MEGRDGGVRKERRVFGIGRKSERVDCSTSLHTNEGGGREGGREEGKDTVLAQTHDRAPPKEGRSR